MSKNHRLSLKADHNSPPVAQSAPAVEATSLPTPEPTTPVVTQEPELTRGPTAKEMAAAEEAAGAKLAAIKAKEDAEAAAADSQPMNIMGLAAKGREALLDGLRQHREKTKPVDYVPPPRTERQMSQLEAEQNAGRAASRRAAEQQAFRPVPKRDPNEALTTPVHRPGDFVPGLYSKDPALTR